jgi:hypothetical protein
VMKTSHILFIVCLCLIIMAIQSTLLLHGAQLCSLDRELYHYFPRLDLFMLEAFFISGGRKIICYPSGLPIHSIESERLCHGVASSLTYRRDLPGLSPPVQSVCDFFRAYGLRS